VERAMLVDELRTIFASRKPQDLLASKIVFKESFDPIADPQDDCRVIYEAAFEPADLDKARIEFWLTDTGHIAVGIETYGRILARTRLLGAIRGGFAAGHEPVPATKEGLQILFDAVTKGRIFIVVWSLLRMASLVRVYMWESDCNAMARSGYRYYGISAIPDENTRGPPVRSGTILSYRPW
jgi:hypothetical protein